MQESVTITGETAHQITHVLRMKSGDHIIVLNNTGWEYEVILQPIAGNNIRGEIIKKELAVSEPKTNLTLYQALLKIDKFEFVLQKGVELGVTSFFPFISERCVMKKPSEIKAKRWQNVIREAAEQSRRARLPVLNQVIPFEEACNQVIPPALILWENEKTQSLATTMKRVTFTRAKKISIFVGPEGGFTLAEIDLARKHGIVPAGLGNRILRAETAGLTTISAIMYQKGELG